MIIKDLPTGKTLEECLKMCVDQTGGKPFVFIIDEWDALIREAKDDPIAQDASQGNFEAPAGKRCPF